MMADEKQYCFNYNASYPFSLSLFFYCRHSFELSVDSITIAVNLGVTYLQNLIVQRIRFLILDFSVHV